MSGSGTTTTTPGTHGNGTNKSGNTSGGSGRPGK